MIAGVVATAAMTVVGRPPRRPAGRRSPTAPERRLHLGPCARGDAPADRAMHRGTGAAAGAVRGVMSARGLRGSL